MALAQTQVEYDSSCSRQSQVREGDGIEQMFYSIREALAQGSTRRPFRFRLDGIPYFMVKRLHHRLNVCEITGQVIPNNQLNYVSSVLGPPDWIRNETAELHRNQ